MFRRAVIGLAVIASVAGAGLGVCAPAQEAQQAPDLNGQWRFEPKRSDTMPGPEAGGERRGPRGGMGGEGGGYGGGGGSGGFGGGHGGGYGGGYGGGRGGGFGGGGGRGGRGGSGGEGDQGPRPEGAAQRPVRLPDLIHITQTDEIVSFEDSTGTVLREITTLGAAKDTLSHAPGAQVASGVWDAQKLVVERQSPRGKVTETIDLEDKGRLLVIRTKIEGVGDQPAREFKRAYSRVTE
jgi:hypothetical protein